MPISAVSWSRISPTRITFGAWRSMEEALNALITDLVWPTTEVTRTIGAVAKGDLTQAMALEVMRSDAGWQIAREDVTARSLANAYSQTVGTIFSQELERLPNIRINTLIPGPVNSPLRRKTHPGENPDSLPQPADILPWYLWLIGPDSRDVRGKTIECAL